MGQRILRISGSLFVDLFGIGKRSYEVIENPIPDDAKIVNAKVVFPYCVGADELMILLESAEWSQAEAGKPIPNIEPRMRTSDAC